MSKDDKTRIFYLAVSIITVAFLYLTAVTFVEIPKTGIDHSKTIVGFLLGVVISTPIGYYYGSSKKEGEGK